MAAARLEPEWVQELISLPGHDVIFRRPFDAAVLLDETEFALRDEFIPYWAELWPSSLALAEALCGMHLTGIKVLEIGCGLGLVSVLAALRGADVTASDWAPEAVAATLENASLNGVSLTPLTADWREGQVFVSKGPWDLVLAADILYEKRNLLPLSVLLPALCHQGARLLLADPGRPHARSFLEGLPLMSKELAPGVYLLCRG